MNSNVVTENTFARLLDAIPPQLLATQSRSALVTACQEIDKLGLIDPRTNEVYLSETNVRNVLERAVSAHAVDQFLARLRAHADHRLLNDQEARSKGVTSIDMLTLIKQSAAFDPPSNPSYE